MGIDTLVLSRNEKDNLGHKGIRLATMHRVKGLDFDHVIIAGANDGVLPLRIQSKSDEIHIEDERILKERSLLFVAATRAKKTLIVTAVGKISEFIE